MSVMKKIRQGNGEIMVQEGHSEQKKEAAMRRPRIRAFHAEGTANAKALRWEGLYVLEPKRRPIWLELQSQDEAGPSRVLLAVVGSLDCIINTLGSRGRV